MQETKISIYGIAIFLLAATFYLYEFALQISPSVMTHTLMRDLHVDALGLGLLSSFYYYTYAPMQLPAGILFDRFGLRLLLGLAVLLCAVGALFFSYTQQLFFAEVGRMLMGAGSAFAFIGTLVLITRWFPIQYFAFLVGMTQLMGSIGAIVSEASLAKAIELFGWRQSLLVLGIFGILLAMAIWLIVRDWPSKQRQALHTQVQRHVWQDLRELLSKAHTWITAAYAFLVWAPITAFAALWGVPFLSKLYEISAAKAGAAVSIIWLGVAFGCPVLGWWSDRSRRRKPVLLICTLLGITSLLLIIYVPMPLPICYLALFFFGIAAAGQSVSFGVVKDNNSSRVAGTAVGFNNMAIVAGGALFQPLIGWLLHNQWQGKLIDNVPYYSLTNFRYALMVLPLCYLLALVIATGLLKESYRTINK
ncbi:MAG: Major facilitator family transporter [Gammaproteobacteria bacterium]|jgi:MFS family permease|nr:Major facilitator family transporter [Gammaproteobacteria bacterium]